MNKKLSEEDKRLFRESMRDVVPLEKKKIAPSQKQACPSPARRIKRAEEQDASQQYPLSDFIAEEVHGDSIVHWFRAPLPTKRLSSFQKGLIPFQRSIDLHGLTSEDARQRFLHFMNCAIADELRCVLIIHGKGGRNHEHPRIKNLVNRWLPQLPFVQGFHSASPRHGGTGALYVLLKKPHQLTANPS